MYAIIFVVNQNNITWEIRTYVAPKRTEFGRCSNTVGREQASDCLSNCTELPVCTQLRLRRCPAGRNVHALLSTPSSLLAQMRKLRPQRNQGQKLHPLLSHWNVFFWKMQKALIAQRIVFFGFSSTKSISHKEAFSNIFKLLRSQRTS